MELKENCMNLNHKVTAIVALVVASSILTGILLRKRSTKIAKIVTLKTLIITFDDNTSNEVIQKVMDSILENNQDAIFVIETGKEIVEVGDA